jgi:hypothetical protein
VTPRIVSTPTGDVLKKPPDVERVLPDGDFLDAPVLAQKSQVTDKEVVMRRLASE